MAANTGDQDKENEMGSYPEDLSWLDEAHAGNPRLRQAAGQIWAVNAWVGGDLYDVVEDWPQVPQLHNVDLDVIPTLRGPLMEITEDERMALHIGFGGTEDEVLALRARGTRYTLRRN